MFLNAQQVATPSLRQAVMSFRLRATFFLALRAVWSRLHMPISQRLFILALRAVWSLFQVSYVCALSLRTTAILVGTPFTPLPVACLCRFTRNHSVRCLLNFIHRSQGRVNTISDLTDPFTHNTQKFAFSHVLPQ